VPRREVDNIATRRNGLRKQRSYTDADRRKAAFQFALYGLMSKVSKEMNIPETTLSGWTREPAWDDHVAASRSEASDTLIAEFSQGAIEAVRACRERVQHGNWRYDTRTGSLVRVPMNGKDLMVVSAIATDKSQVLQGRPSSITVSADSRLAALLDKFETAGKALRQAKPTATIDGDTGEVIKD